MDLERDGNLIEAGFWFVVGVILLVKACQASGRLRRIFFVLTVALFAFSISDLIEARTGAWWKPIWLLLLKVSCVTVLFFGFRAYYKLPKAERSPATIAPPQP
jgi:hypothetical protein